MFWNWCRFRSCNNKNVSAVVFGPFWPPYFWKYRHQLTVAQERFVTWQETVKRSSDKKTNNFIQNQEPNVTMTWKLRKHSFLNTLLSFRTFLPSFLILLLWPLFTLDIIFFSPLIIYSIKRKNINKCFRSTDPNTQNYSLNDETAQKTLSSSTNRRMNESCDPSTYRRSAPNQTGWSWRSRRAAGRRRRATSSHTPLSIRITDVTVTQQLVNTELRTA